jgi:hypothetical protein
MSPVVREEVGRLIAIDPELRGEVEACVIALRRTLHLVLESLERALEKGPGNKEALAAWVLAHNAAVKELVAAHQALGVVATSTSVTTVERVLQYTAEHRQTFLQMAREEEGRVVEGEVVGE